MLADLYLRGRLKLDELVAHTSGLDGIWDAFESLRAGTEARTVLLPHG
jgi:Zn-dependent alcohol dehydrogenase